MATSTVEARLNALGFQLPAPPPAIASYVGMVQTGDTIFVSGHGPYLEGEWVHTGKVGGTIELEEAQAAARLVVLNMLATVKEAVDLDDIKRVVKLLVFVNSVPDFTEQYLVANSASELLVDVFGSERGPHARSAVGMVSLPFDISVEIEGVFAA